MQKILPKDLTSYDLLKALALVIMVIDHFGAFFMPHDVWFRAIGRTGFPIWFFLIGYSNSRRVPVNMLIGGTLVTAAFVVGGMYLLPVNVLFALALTRLCVDAVMRLALRNYIWFWLVLVVVIIAVLPSRIVLEYGTLGLLFAMYGYLRRHKTEVMIDASAMFLFVVTVAFVFIISQTASLNIYEGAPYACMALGTLAVCGLLYIFQPQSCPALTRWSGPLAPVLRFMGRWTLEIYVVHVLLFLAVAAFLHPEKALFSFDWVSPGLWRTVS